MLKPMKRNKVLAIAANAFLIVWGGVLMAAGPLDSSMNIEKEMDKIVKENLSIERTELTKKEALKNGRPVSEWVFTNTRGQMLSRTVIENALNRCLKEVKLRRIRIHDLRHTYATIRLLRGHNVGDVSYQLGHSSIKITYDTYAHWIPGKFKSEVDELDHPINTLQNVENTCI